MTLGTTLYFIATQPYHSYIPSPQFVSTLDGHFVPLFYRVIDRFVKHPTVLHHFIWTLRTFGDKNA